MQQRHHHAYRRPISAAPLPADEPSGWLSTRTCTICWHSCARRYRAADLPPSPRCLILAAVRSRARGPNTPRPLSHCYAHLQLQAGMASASAAAPPSEPAAAAAPATGGGGKGDGLDAELPVLDPVGDYEKIKRIGEGTFGIVCETGRCEGWGEGSC